ncbi:MULTISPECIES: SDR family NAD(P)-dependent oxidoreductase [unclassified Amycolatopsis]|uniref:SDR family NAD(P)-dependent oxidoreductase n=1 Tax=unclassified Amycolatopsis TaxID=2618356 RepID=UPI001C6A38AF|nr:glucose 1-dehydrogenase [Amycolatopsis sp. DSM 110486]QYN20180.1 glucose 1-dehydrogenase [Amycolatopsis sp. DSM 110486]
MGKLSGHVAVVTGGARGLGRQIVEAMAGEGAAVAIASRHGDACTEAAEQIRRDHDVDAIGVECNIGSWSACDSLVETVYARFGRADVLVNNAGMALPYRTIDDLDERMWRKVLEVNLLGAVSLSQSFGARMAEAGSGSIINITSTGAVRPKDPFVPYAVAKAGLNTLTQAHAQAFGPMGVRVNAIQCGPFRTRMAEAWDEKAVAVLERTAALRRIGDPEEIRAAAVYLATSDSAFVTGTILQLDGGATF